MADTASRQGGGGSSPFRVQARIQANWCTELGSPFTARLCTLLADRLDPDSPLGRRLDQWPGDAFADLLALRLAAALHARVRSGRAPTLAAHYPPAPPTADDDFWAALVPELARPAILPWLDSAPQTNEVGRSAVLMPGLLTIADRTGLPLRLLELGSSAGLNLVPDRYAYRLGGLSAGSLGSGLVLDPDWEGPPPPAAALRIQSRLGVDLNPLDLSDPADRTRLLAYVWPDQQARIERTAAAIAIAADDPPEIRTGDAADFVEAQALPSPGCTTTVYHSIAFQYFPATVQDRISAHMERAGAAATPEAPLAWLRFELDDPAEPAAPTLRLRLWPGGTDTLLARAHPHGTRLLWLA